MNLKILKKQNGFVMSDAILAILILIMCTSIITSLVYNIILNSKAVKIASQEIAYITELFNEAEIMDYEQITTDSLIGYVNQRSDSAELLSAGEDFSTLTTPYKMVIDVQKYVPVDKTNGEKDLIKIIKAKVQCSLGKKTYSMEMSTLRKIKNAELEQKLRGVSDK